MSASNSAEAYMKNLFFCFIIFVSSSCAYIDTKESETKAHLRLLNDTLLLYKKEKGRFPSTEEGLQILYKEGYFSSEGDGGLYLDAWTSPLIYIGPSAKDSPFFLYSVGENKIDENGKGDDIVCCEF